MAGIEEDFETIRRAGGFIEVESSDEDAAKFYAALSRIEAHFKGWDAFWKERDALKADNKRLRFDCMAMEADRMIGAEPDLMDKDRIEQLRRWPAFDLDEVELDELLDAYQQRNALKSALEVEQDERSRSEAERDALRAALEKIAEGPNMQERTSLQAIARQALKKLEEK
jgi:hypothetical protein